MDERDFGAAVRGYKCLVIGFYVHFCQDIILGWTESCVVRQWDAECGSG